MSEFQPLLPQVSSEEEEEEGDLFVEVVPDNHIHYCAALAEDNNSLDAEDNISLDSFDEESLANMAIANSVHQEGEGSPSLSKENNDLYHDDTIPEMNDEDFAEAIRGPNLVGMSYMLSLALMFCTSALFLSIFGTSLLA